MQTKEYGRASTYYFIGNIFNKGIAFLTIPIFTRILSTTDYGIVTTYNSWVSILSLVIGLAIPMGIRASFIDYEQEKDSFLSVCTTFTLLTGAAVSFLVSGTVLLFRIDVGLTLVFLVDSFDARVSFGKLIGDFAGIVGRAIVDEENLKVLMGLVNDGIKTFW